jgi:hypothetical protein
MRWWDRENCVERNIAYVVEDERINKCAAPSNPGLLSVMSQGATRFLPSYLV